MRYFLCLKKNLAAEAFSSRLGFILVSAGCAIGIGNVWKFPYLCGAAFILIYLAFLLLMGIPVMVCEFAIGRGSRWHRFKGISIVGCYMLMMYYTTVTGWMLYYCWLHLNGTFVGASPQFIGTTFGTMLKDPTTMVFWTAVTCVLPIYFR